MITLDTFAKTIAAGGGDEDKAKDQGKVFASGIDANEGASRAGLMPA